MVAGCRRAGTASISGRPTTVASCSDDERAVLFRFFALAAPLFQEATDELRRTASEERRRR